MGTIQQIRYVDSPFSSLSNFPSFKLPPPPTTVDSLVSLLHNAKDIRQTHQIHAFLLRNGFQDHPILSFKLHRSYSSLGNLDQSLNVFFLARNPNVFFSTSIIQTLILYDLHIRALDVYVQMMERRLTPNAFTVSSILKSCPTEPGIQIHGHAVKLGLYSNLYVRACLVELYARISDPDSAWKVFGKMPGSSLVLLTAMISCYAKCEMVDQARKLFDEAGKKDSVLWNVMIDSYAKHGLAYEALNLFRQMLKSKVRPTEVTIVAALSACAQIGILESGKWVHSIAENKRIPFNTRVGTALVDMYYKCGSLEDARAAFARITSKDVIAWNSMISCYAMHGEGQQALFLLDEMTQSGNYPTDITMISILQACGHSGLVREGREIFSSMREKYGVEPKAEHYGCMVSLLARAGLVKEAYGLVKEMGVKGDSVMWRSLIGGCRDYGAMEMGAVKEERADAGSYVMASNVLARVGDWEGVGKVRALMKSKGMEKEAGFSWIDVHGVTHHFVAGDRTHFMAKEIYFMLEMIHQWL